MASTYDNVLVSVLTENNEFSPLSEEHVRVDMSRQGDCINLGFTKANVPFQNLTVDNDTEFARFGKQSVLFTKDQNSTKLTFPTIHIMKTFQFRLRELRNGLKSVFTDRTDEASAVQYFQFYGYLSQQQNMMQDYIRCLDVGAGSGILSFFAIQAGARKVYAIEASSMAVHCETLVRNNKMSDKIIVLPGKVEEVDIPEPVDTIISEPMGYMLFNERMLETYLHAKKWLKPGGKMFPTQGDLHISPFTDEALYLEQFSKANFWYQQSFHGIDLTSIRSAAVEEYFKQPVVDTFDMKICLAKSVKYTVDFQTANETDLHVIEIPLTFSMHQSGLVHGLAFWFDVAFLGTAEAVWLSTAPTETLTHWYQVRCLVQTPVLVKQGQTLTGKCVLRSNTRQSYDVDIELNIPGTNTKSTNSLDLKNPFFRYTGQTVSISNTGNNTVSPTDAYWNSIATGQQITDLNAGQTVYMNGIVNGVPEAQQVQVLTPQGVVQNNLIPVSNVAAPINPGSIPSVLNLTSNAHRTSVGAGISPVNFTQTQNMMPGGNGSVANFPVSNQFMIGDYVMPGNIVIPSQTRNKTEAM
ncbi:hypothetical protein FSP39_010867 [Pinctada imbricata]|uniref:type I protein arginine methyltransferase n=1 Tax=Pinctada imbricata TaxID=66713 RepID=A0AA88XRI8_PINIB|nr:hypothetical protein FSP39_010867 [Pinctada imbricata]